MNNICKNCKWWKNEQSEMAFSKFVGFCISPTLEYNISKGASVSVLDRSNLHPTHQDTTHHLENIESFKGGKQKSKRYSLVTQEHFGCINIEFKK